MPGLNKVQLIGRLGRDPELRYLQSGVAVCKLALATSKKYTNKQHEQVEGTEWHRVTVWGKQAENVNNWTCKGSQLYIEGELKTTSYDKEGQKHYTTEIVARAIQFLSTKAETEANRAKSPPKTPQEPGARKSPNNSGNPPDSNEQPSDFNEFNDFGGNPGDDDIPF